MRKSDDKKTGKVFLIKRRTRGPNMLAKEVSHRRRAGRKAGLMDETIIQIPDIQIPETSKKQDLKMTADERENFKPRRWFAGTGSGGATIVKDPPTEKKEETG